MIGRFLEISVHAPDILASLAFYESLGFQQLQVNETWPHPYAAVTDGRITIGLHQEPMPSMLTFVMADVGKHLQPLRAMNVEFELEKLGSEEFNEVIFSDPYGQQVRIIEARTFSPADIAPGYLSSCGYFVEYGMPVKEFSPGVTFWEQVGLIAMEQDASVFDRVSLTSDYLNLGLHRSRALRHPVLIFEDEEMAVRIQSLKARDFLLSDEMPDALDDSANAVLIAPEGTRLLLMQS